jgi:DNA-binding CsgD family transcriptional regulator
VLERLCAIAGQYGVVGISQTIDMQQIIAIINRMTTTLPSPETPIYHSALQIHAAPNPPETAIINGREYPVPRLDAKIKAALALAASGHNYRQIAEQTDMKFDSLSSDILMHAHDMGLDETVSAVNRISMVDRVFRLGILQTGPYDPRRWPITKPLSMPEKIALHWVATGLSPSAIANESGLALYAVHRYRDDLFKKVRTVIPELAIAVGHYANLFDLTPQSASLPRQRSNTLCTYAAKASWLNLLLRDSQLPG